jgi:hypothetical protein
MEKRRNISLAKMVDHQWHWRRVFRSDNLTKDEIDHNQYLIEL